MKGLSSALIVVAIIAVLGSAFFLTDGFKNFDLGLSIPTQNFDRSVAYSGTEMNYQFGFACTGGGYSEKGAALTGIPQEKYDLGLDDEKSYILVEAQGKSGKAPLGWTRLGNSPYGLLRSGGENTLGWSYGMNFDRDMDVGSVAGVNGGSCAITYHIVFNNPPPSAFACGNEACEEGETVNTCFSDCGQPEQQEEPGGTVSPVIELEEDTEPQPQPMQQDNSGLLIGALLLIVIVLAFVYWKIG